ncbi:hypothetical protein [Flavobacterium limi]|uniref:Lipoprotein n=1 Tax=Flavobacterium limi TaxID=2045105 RepID=A0ABQ1UWY8_9FLAO|nr:hypothetical protein [Flavobacterium limi]GGF27191.1 hypothetical protein GCM10011518_40670 [Flavobacterium limi]
MKKFIFLIFLILTACNDSNYKSLSSEKTDTESLLKKINPNRIYDYWEINFCLGISPKTVFYKGDKKLKERYNYNCTCLGFFHGCQPMSCSYNITYLKNGKWNYVYDEKELASFIYKIDNPEEAFLIAKIHDFDIDPYNQKGNGYLKTKNGYDLKVMKYISCPESKESFIISIDSTGQLKRTESQGFYLKTKNCIVY